MESKSAKSHIMRLQTLQNKAVKVVYRLDLRMPTKEIYHKYNIMMVKDMYKASMIEFVFKVIKNLVPPIFQNYHIFNARRVTRQNK